MTIVLFVLVFGVIVVGHELGHFLLAKANGITVVEFSVGMGPWREWGMGELSCTTW